MMENLKISVNLIFGIIIALLFVEILLRIFNAVPLLDKFLVPDDYLIYHLKPNLNDKVQNADGLYHDVKTIDLGFKDIGFRDDGINGEPFSVVLGDSFSAAFEVNMTDSWPQLLEEKLGKDVANMALYGYGSLQEKRMLEKYGVKLKPKLILWEFFGNDFSDDFNAFNTLNNKETLFEKIYKEFRVVRFAWNNLAKIRRLSDSVFYNDDKLNIILWPNQWRNLYPITPDSTAVQVGEKITKVNILEAKSIAESNGAKFILILFPNKDQVYWQFIKDKVKTITLEELNYPVEEIKKFCTENNIVCLDLTPKLIELSSNEEQIYFTRDGHFNEKGNSVVADVIYKYLIENNLAS